MPPQANADSFSSALRGTLIIHVKFEKTSCFCIMRLQA